MNTKVLKIAFILSLFGMTFNSCQDEDIESANAPKSRSIPDGMQCLMIPDTTTSTHSLSKKAIGKKFSEVYFQTFDDSIPDKYKTIKIRDVKGNICQEWFYENLHSKLINDYSHQPND